MISGGFNTTDYPNIDNLHLSLNRGVNLLISNPNADNVPGNKSGMLVHMQRLAKGDNSASQIIWQLHFSSDENIYVRRGIGDGTNVQFNLWKKLSIT